MEGYGFLAVFASLFCSIQAVPWGHSDEGYMQDSWALGGTDLAMLSGRMTKPTCVAIPTNMSLCHDIGYHRMRLPNLLEHDTLSEVTEQARSWVPLLGIECHPDTKLFLCSLFSPVCLDRPIYPCRSLCEAVKQGCESKMIVYGYPWPSMVNCTNFPPDNDLCIKAQNKKPKPEEDNECDACRGPETLEGIVDNKCRADFVIKMRVKKVVKKKLDLKLITHKKKPRVYLLKNDVTKRNLRKLSLYIENASTCKCSRIGSGKGTYLIMGRKIKDKLVVTYILDWKKLDSKKKNTRKAIKLIKKENICQGGMEMLSDMDPAIRTMHRHKRQRNSRSILTLE